ncbi:hypothetical protein BGP77_02920 [Saccharospirillum sp. MSK14-1]|uniref:hypothetical protein n=1 Tax=Saccharospirillum sp. MSK14-1 TaxID=1897632 RepID=UPI000D352A5A|nr:hypothetical protein [Saccharospirillum sp. MSK14-1]PTY36279.1 hypothetical protein BGP77_02920 [Saccharospirillum sp. MSK14-1]
MAAIILGKNLLSEDELIEYAFSNDNSSDLNLGQLRTLAGEAAMLSSLMLIRIMKADRIYIPTRPSITGQPPNH